MSTRHFARLVFGSIFGAVIAISLLSAIPAQGQTYTVIADIPSTVGLENPAAQKIVQGRNGDLYSASGGAVYSLTLSGTDTLVASIFRENNAAGVTLGTDGNFYSTSALGGTGSCGFYGCGYVWNVSPSGVLTTLYNFTGTPDGCNPTAAPVQAPSGIFYGTTPSNCNGGSNDGIIYSITTGGTYTVLHTFSGSDGATPVAPLTVGPDGNLYGGTSGGGTNSFGVLFRISPAGTYTVLHNFAGTAGSDGQDVESGMIVGSDGNLYGVTYRGGTGSIGVIFKLSTSGTYSIIAQVPQPGTPPVTSLVQGTDGKFYGIFGGGGTGGGAIYSVTTSGTITGLHNFCQQSGCTDGANALTPLVQDTDGKFYSVTQNGGPAGCNSGIGCGVFYSFDVGLGAFINLTSTSGKVGSKVSMFGQGFSSSSVVKFNGVAATKITLNGTTYITATVPTGATDGYVTVTTGSTTLKSTQTYTVHDSWASGTAMPTGVQWPMTGTIGSKIYVVGGYTATVAVANNAIYNPMANTWSSGAALPTAMAQGASAVVNNILYVFGGSSDGGGTVSNAVWAYNPATNSWSSKSAMPTARCSSVAVVEGNVVYVIGGFNGSRLSTVESYNPATDTWTAKAPLLVGKSEISAGLIGTTIVAADGFSSVGVTGDTEAYNASTGTWTSKQSDPTFRNGACAGAIGGDLYASDGNDNSNNAFSVNESFNLTGNKWTTLTTMPQTVTDAGPAVYKGQLYCFGGSSVANAFRGTVYNNVQIYQP